MKKITWYHTKMTSNTAPSPFKTSASSEYSDGNYPAWKAFNGVSDATGAVNAWASATGDINGAYLQIDFGEIKKVNVIKFRGRGSSGSEGQTPTSFSIYWTSDMINWTKIKDVSKSSWNLNEELDVFFDAVNIRGFKFIHYSSNSTLVAWNLITFGLEHESNKGIIKNTKTNSYYSLSDNTLIHLPNSLTKNMILHGIEQGKEAQLDVPFSKHNYINESPVANVKGKVFTQDVGKMNTLNIGEIKENNFEHIYTWYYTNMTSNTTPPPLIASSSSSQSANYAPFKAFNGTSINKDDCFMTSTNTIGEYIQIHYGTEKLINCVAITSRNSDEPTSAIKDVNILGSTDGINFTNIGEIRNQTDWTQNSKRIFNLIEGHYMTIKLEILSNNEEIRTTIGNILYGYKREVN